MQPQTRQSVGKLGFLVLRTADTSDATTEAIKAPRSHGKEEGNVIGSGVGLWRPFCGLAGFAGRGLGVGFDFGAFNIPAELFDFFNKLPAIVHNVRMFAIFNRLVIHHLPRIGC